MKRQTKHDIMFILNLNKEPHLESSSHQVMGFILTINIGHISNLEHMLTNKQTKHGIAHWSVIKHAN